ncbi:Eco57I restriction-modification methylase domain-containing protein [Streptococcus ruminantium]|uniref:Eco57I restriction-modification methylase domain-containing protein n=1 Tax=Streptococcus ruminantium TaxID=1917441 RepID=UPI00280FD752|nr:Eco57I restriction-modification methylase domain-containing protein [Streptococcus ruminantium]MDQ8765566.1 Eco57I restriction-modification methylase domain-containing protein [Streptococcus ruminantium]MDQ8767837.1 Eco57I restriction-modification methylase domain-containing protein [Streptococcus ruminantium]MDQ8780466.1 Eco57I restriction-modification methylase domain-containing protein [Streptococcus ruminantium]MDQ8820045.1 Eco57I restriction-modification methylase domain-containing prot
MISNFEFLAIDIDTAELFRTINMAEENYTHGDYEGTLTKVRKVAENTARLVADREYLDISERATFNDVLREIRDFIPNKTIVDHFYDIKGKGNNSAHVLNPEDATKENALKSLKQVFDILAWVMLTYIEPDIKASAIGQFLEPRAQEMYTTAERKFIYIQTVNNESGLFNAFEGTQKIGEGSVSSDDIETDWSPNSDFLRTVAPKRINQYMKTSGLPYTLGWVELAYKKATKSWFHDYDVHNVLKRSGIKQAEQLEGTEWFKTDLETAKAAIKAVKEGRNYLNITAKESFIEEPVITLRPEQEAAVEQTQNVFKKKDRMLWNAKMRFGKTLTSLQLVKNEAFQKVLIMTHRPVVADSWFDDFKKMKMSEAGYDYGSVNQGETLENLKRGDKPFVYFASIQLLRYNGGQTNLKDFADVDWDLIIIDEAHEGTQTELSDSVMKELVKEHTKILELSGTPFNLLDQFDEEQVYTWDYVMEQQAKKKWELERPSEPNPYETLPKVSMYTFEMKHKERFSDESKSFNFREFFRVAEDGQLVYKQEVRQFLDNITHPDSRTNYPFSTKSYREELRHTLWLMPGVKEANAFEDLLKEHPIFGKEYKIVNVVRGASSDDGIANDADIEKVRSAIGKDPSQTKTITLTVRKLTTGVNIPEWTAVLFLSNTNSAMNYLQAAFRAQTPFSHEKLGMKTNCYVFDFAPDRALTVMAESAQINSGVGKKNTQAQKQAMARLLNFMPILGASDNGMKTYDVDRMLTQLKKVYAEKAVRSGFEDDSLYNDNLLTLTADDASMFTKLNAIVGKTQSQKTPKKVVINENGLTTEEHERAEKAKKKPKAKRTAEDLEVIEKQKEARKQRKNMISILRGVSIRIPMMIYGMAVDLSKDITIQDFIKQVDDESWKEFMPKGFTKGMFSEITKYYDAEVFIEAGRIIRQRAKSFDDLDFIERAEQIAELFGTFKNPDKETVLTPWRVVNLQVSKSVGGLNFYDDNFESVTDGATSNLHWVSNEVTPSIYQRDTKILDINSKTGLYPLHSAISLYYQRVAENDDNHFEADQVYQEILANNIYAIAKTPMAKTITERTLTGYRKYKTNVTYIESLTDTLKTDSEQGKKLVEEVFNKVKFDVVIGNPPYQEETNNNRDTPIYHHFMELAYEVSDKAVLVTPARFLFNAGQTPSAWNAKMLEDEHLKVVYYSQNSAEVFPNTDIKGGVAVTYRDSKKNFGAIGQFISIPELNNILHKVLASENFISLSILHYGNSTYKLTPKVYQEHPDFIERVSQAERFSVGSNIFSRLPEIFYDNQQNDTDIQIYGREDNKRVYKWTKKEYIEEHPNLDKYKIFIPGANGSGAIGEVLSTPLIGEPLIGHTQTFISFGAFDHREEAENLLKYIKTKFARTMLGTLKITQNNKTKEVWKNIPLQDFTFNSDIDWLQSIAEIDRQLYRKYGLSEDEIAFIESKVKEMG